MLFLQRSHGFRFHCVNNEAEFIAESLVSVGHADLGNIGPTDVVSFMPVFQIIQPQEVFLVLKVKSHFEKCVSGSEGIF